MFASASSSSTDLGKMGVGRSPPKNITNHNNKKNIPAVSDDLLAEVEAVKIALIKSGVHLNRAREDLRKCVN